MNEYPTENIYIVHRPRDTPGTKPPKPRLLPRFPLVLVKLANRGPIGILEAIP